VTLLLIIAPISRVKEGSDCVKDSISMTDFEDHGEVIYPADNIDAIVQALSVKSLCEITGGCYWD
jgi:hypothetical protein